MNISIRSIGKWGIFVCLLYVQWYRWVFGERSIILYATAGCVALCMAIELLFTHKERGVTLPYAFIGNLVLCGYSIITGLFVAKSYDVLIETTKTLLAFSITCLALCYFAAEDGINWLDNGIILVALTCSVWATFRGYYLPGYGMVLSATNNPHTLGVVMDLGIFALAYRCKQNVKSFAIHLLFASIFLYTIIQCGSRKCLFAAAIILIPWFLSVLKQVLKNGTYSDRWIIILLYITISAVAIFYFFHEFVGSNSYERIANIEESHANQLRIEYYQLGLDYLMESPFLGIGLGQFAVWSPYGTYSHSTIVEAFSSWGIMGGFLYFTPMVIAICRSFKLAFRHGDNKSVIIAALCVMEIFLSFLQIFFYNLIHMVTWSVIFVYIYKNYKTDKQVVRRCKYVKA